MAEGARNALIVASSDYADPELRRLQTPATDARALEAVLRDPGIGGFEVRTLLNRPNQEVALAVEEFFADRQPDDMLLVHFSCHGIKDEDGELYFAMANSMLHRLASTAVAANFVNQRMNRSRSKRVVLLLDCCYAGAFERGMMARAAGGAVGIEGQFAGGRGRAVITASDAMQYAYEGGELAVTGELGPSVFTSALVSGLETGEADRDQDGQVALDELYDYIYDKVQSVTPNQTPCKWTYGVRGELFIARRSRPVTTPSPLPDDIHKAVENRLASVRLGAVQELEPLLRGRHQGLALAARLTLEQLTDDDSRAVSAAATAVLGTEEPPSVPPRLDPSTTLVDFGPLTQHSQSPELSVRLGNAGGGNLNAHAATQASWVRLRQVGDEFYVAVDTGTVSEHEGVVTVDSDGGSATILVKASVVPALQPTPEPAAAISVAAEAVRADAVPAETVPAADSSARPGPRPDTVSRGSRACAGAGKGCSRGDATPRSQRPFRCRHAFGRGVHFPGRGAFHHRDKRSYSENKHRHVAVVGRCRCLHLRDSSHPGRIQAVLGLCEYHHMGAGLVPGLVHQHYRFLELDVRNCDRRSPCRSHSGSSCQCRPLHLGNCLPI